MVVDKPISLDRLYHPTLATIFSCILYTTCILSTLLFILTFYTILKKSTKEMVDYKYILMAQCIWNFLFDLCMNAWQPIAAYPFFLAYSKGVIKYLGLKGSYLSIQAVLFVASGLIHCLLFALFYRVVQIFYGTIIYEMFNTRKRLICTYFISGVIFIGSFQSE